MDVNDAEGMAMEAMKTVRVAREIDGETWVVVVQFDNWTRGPQYDEAPAVVTRDGEALDGAKWGNVFGGEPPDRALIENGGLWAPGVVGLRPRTSGALATLTIAVQRAVAAHREADGRREVDAADDAAATVRLASLGAQGSGVTQATAP